MQNEQEPGLPSLLPNKDAMDLLLVLSNIVSAKFRPFFFWRGGTHAYAHGAPWACLGLLFLAQVYPPMRIWFAAWLVMLVFHRITADREQHSRYLGRPWVAMLIPFVKREETGRVVTAFILLGIGIALSDTDEFFSMFFMAGFAAMLIQHFLTRAMRRKRLHRMRDAQIEHENLAYDLKDGW